MSNNNMELFAVTNKAERVRVQWYYDPDYDPEGTWALDTDEETTSAVQAERRRLESGELIALGAAVETRCGECKEWGHKDSLWGIVVTSAEAHDGKHLEALALCMLDMPEAEPPTLLAALERIAAHESRADRRNRNMVCRSELEGLQRIARVAIDAAKGRR